MMMLLNIDKTTRQTNLQIKNAEMSENKKFIQCRNRNGFWQLHL